MVLLPSTRLQNGVSPTISMSAVGMPSLHYVDFAFQSQGSPELSQWLGYSPYTWQPHVSSFVILTSLPLRNPT